MYIDIFSYYLSFFSLSLSPLSLSLSLYIYIYIYIYKHLFYIRNMLTGKIIKTT